ncbi:MAG: DUF4421 family protein [Bacteroidota bacterium]
MRNRILIILLFFSSQLYAQLPDIPIQTYNYDTNYIDYYGNLFAVRFVSPRRIYDFRLKNRITQKNITYRPNLQSAFGLGFTYKWLSFDIIINPKWNTKKNEERGETKEFNVKGTLYLQKHMVDVLLRRYQGMHIANPEDFFNPWDGTYPYRPDMRSTYFAISYTIPSNYTQYAPKTTFQLDGRMKKSAGSLMYLSSFQVWTMKADSSIVPPVFEREITTDARIVKSGMVMLQQSVGYAYTFVHKQFYLTLSAMPGLSLAMGTVHSKEGSYNPVTLNFLLESKNGIGYNSRRWYTGLYFIYKYQNVKLTNELAFNNNLGELKVFIGYRIHAPYVVRSIIDQ